MCKKAYAMALESCIQDAGAMWMNHTTQGDMAECIFALGYLYQSRSCQALEGIMDLVVYIENKIRAPEHPAEQIEKQGEQLP
eukprot:4786237-Heterocapsa_arctica.AAC.1